MEVDDAPHQQQVVRLTDLVSTGIIIPGDSLEYMGSIGAYSALPRLSSPCSLIPSSADLLFFTVITLACHEKILCYCPWLLVE